MPARPDIDSIAGCLGALVFWAIIGGLAWIVINMAGG
jgi:hypothetical protein